MKTTQEFYEIIRWDKELWESFGEAVKEGKAEDFMRSQGCEASFTELTAHLQALQKELRSSNEVEALSLDELENVAGGFPDMSECLSNCFLAGVYVAWLHDYCPKCEAYL